MYLTPFIFKFTVFLIVKKLLTKLPVLQVGEELYHTGVLYRFDFSRNPSIQPLNADKNI